MQRMTLYCRLYARFSGHRKEKVQSRTEEKNKSYDSCYKLCPRLELLRSAASLWLADFNFSRCKELLSSLTFWEVKLKVIDYDTSRDGSRCTDDSLLPIIKCKSRSAFHYEADPIKRGRWKAFFLASLKMPVTVLTATDVKDLFLMEVKPKKSL